MAQPQPVMPSFSLISLSLLVNSIIFLALATLSVALRFYARRVKSLDLQWDDWTILISLVRSRQSLNSHPIRGAETSRF